MLFYLLYYKYISKRYFFSVMINYIKKLIIYNNILDYINNMRKMAIKDK